MRAVAIPRSPLLRASLLLTVALLSPACGTGPYLAPASAAISFGETTLDRTAGTYCDTEPDYTGGLFLITAGVIDTFTELPLENVQVDVQVDALAGIYVLPQEAVKTVDFPAADTDVNNQGDVHAACVDENGNFDNTDEWCAWYWDTDTAQYYEFGQDYADAGGYAPTYYSTATDNRGLIQIFMFMDCIYGDSNLYADIGVSNAEFQLSSS